MNATTERIIAEIEQLPQNERALIAEKILLKLDDTDETFDPEVELAWQKEIAKRMEELDSGKVEGIPWEEVRAKLRNEIKTQTHHSS